MFVCLGNICRSPAAEAVMRQLIRERGLEDLIQIDSSGTCAYHIGEDPDVRMRAAARGRGITISHRSQQLKVSDALEHDYLFAMDSANYRDILEQLDASLHGKVYLFRDFDPEGTGDVPDPYYGGPQGFEQVMDLLQRTSAALLGWLTEEASR